MTKFMNTLTIAALTSVAFAPAAFAGDKADKVMEPAKVELIETSMTETVKAPEARIITLQAEMETEVRGAVERGEYIPVEGPDGRVYYNRIIPVSDLPDPELDVRVIETYDFDHEGAVYTNKIVEDVN